MCMCVFVFMCTSVVFICICGFMCLCVYLFSCLCCHIRADGVGRSLWCCNLVWLEGRTLVTLEVSRRGKAFLQSVLHSRLQKLGTWMKVIYTGFPLSLVWGRRTAMFQLSGFYGFYCNHWAGKWPGGVGGSWNCVIMYSWADIRSYPFSLTGLI